MRPYDVHWYAKLQKCGESIRLCADAYMKTQLHWVGNTKTKDKTNTVSYNTRTKHKRKLAYHFLPFSPFLVVSPNNHFSFPLSSCVFIRRQNFQFCSPFCYNSSFVYLRKVRSTDFFALFICCSASLRNRPLSVRLGLFCLCYLSSNTTTLVHTSILWMITKFLLVVLHATLQPAL